MSIKKIKRLEVNDKKITLVTNLNYTSVKRKFMEDVFKFYNNGLTVEQALLRAKKSLNYLLQLRVKKYINKNFRGDIWRI